MNRKTRRTRIIPRIPRSAVLKIGRKAPPTTVRKSTRKK